jgi:hypothetical protein
MAVEEGVLRRSRNPRDLWNNRDLIVTESLVDKGFWDRRLSVGSAGVEP